MKYYFLNFSIILLQSIVIYSRVKSIFSLSIVTILPLLYNLFWLFPFFSSLLFSFTHGGFYADPAEVLQFSLFVNLYWLFVVTGFLSSRVVSKLLFSKTPNINPFSSPRLENENSHFKSLEITKDFQVLSLLSLSCLVIPLIFLGYIDDSELFYTTAIGRFSSGRLKEYLAIVDLLLWMLPVPVGLIKKNHISFFCIIVLITASIMTGERHAALSLVFKQLDTSKKTICF